MMASLKILSKFERLSTKQYTSIWTKRLPLLLEYAFIALFLTIGSFAWQENLKRYVRDMLNRKRLIALILLDNPQESIMDLMVCGLFLRFWSVLTNTLLSYILI